MRRLCPESAWCTFGVRRERSRRTKKVSLPAAFDGLETAAFAALKISMQTIVHTTSLYLRRLHISRGGSGGSPPCGSPWAGRARPLATGADETTGSSPIELAPSALSPASSRWQAFAPVIQRVQRVYRVQKSPKGPHGPHAQRRRTWSAPCKVTKDTNE